MIIDKFAHIKIHTKNRVFYERLGYDTTTDYIYVKFDDIKSPTNTYINVQCDYCGTIFKMPYSRANNRKHICSYKCRTVHNETMCLEKYGVKNHTQREEIKEKIQKTCLEKYGVKNPAQSDDIKERIRNSFIEKYGVDHNFKVAEVIEKRKQTYIKNYGVDNPLKSKKVRDKIKSTHIEKYGVDHNFKVAEVIEKRKQTYIKNYGVDNPWKSTKIKEKIRMTCIDKYGVDHPMKCNVIKDKVNKTNLKIYGTKRPLQNTEVFERMFKNYKKTIKDKYDVDCVFQIPEVFTKMQDNSFRRFSYRHLHYQANYEKDFIKYCEKLGFIDEVSDGPFVWYLYNGKRRRYFSDFYIKKYNLIIEVKSMYWYNSFKEQNKAKREECLRQGFNFIFIIDKDYSEFNKYLEQQGLFKQCTSHST